MREDLFDGSGNVGLGSLDQRANANVRVHFLSLFVSAILVIHESADS
jgi:hypothetical protein